jgi:hypothetical protein
MSNGNFKVGDNVVVIEKGKTYSVYSEFMKKYAGLLMHKWVRGYSPDNSTKGRVVALDYHSNERDLIAVVENENNVFLINVQGLEKVETESKTTVIYRKDRETIALLKDGNQTIKSAKAICNPTDTFNAEYGAKLAFARLYGLDEKVIDVLLNGVKEVVAVRTDGNFKARCINTNGDTGLTKGKVYEFKDGFSNWNDGEKFPQREKNGISRFGCFEDLEKWFSSFTNYEFEEVKEETNQQPFDWDGFKSGKFAVHCDTEEKAKIFLWECEQQGITWESDRKPTCKTSWEDYGTATCYSCMWNHGKVGYGYVELHKGVREVVDYSPNYREVKRPAKVDEWIKIVSATPTSVQNYKNGDIFTVIREGTCWDEYVNVTGINGFIDHDEYAVLEPITPTVKESKPFDITQISDTDLINEIARRFNS